MTTTICLNCEKCGALKTVSAVKKIAFGQPPEFYTFPEMMKMHGWAWVKKPGQTKHHALCPNCQKGAANGDS